MNKCPYCETINNDFMVMNQTVEYSRIELAMNRQGMLRTRCYDVSGDSFETQDIIEIKYCPMCGKQIVK